MEKTKGFIKFYTNKGYYGFTEDDSYFVISDITNLKEYAFNPTKKRYEIEYYRVPSEKKEGAFCAKNIYIINEIPQNENLVLADDWGSPEAKDILGPGKPMDKTDRVSLLFPEKSNVVSYRDVLDDNGIKTVVEQIRANDISDEKDVKYGLVFYYIQNKIAYIVNLYINPSYRTNKKLPLDWSYSFVPQLVRHDTNAIGRVNTGKFVYLVSFKENQGVVSKITFISKILKKKIIWLSVEQEYRTRETYIKLKGITDVESDEDSSTLSSLNSIVDMRLRVGNIEQCINCLQLIESRKTVLKTQEFYSLKLRLLPIIYKNKGEDKYRKEIISCCKELLEYQQKDTYKLTLMLEMANKQRQGGEYSDAANTYREWLSFYNSIISHSPERANGLFVAYNQVERGLEQCESNNTLSSSEYQNLADTTDTLNEESIDSLLMEVMDVVEQQALNYDSKWREYKNVAEWPENQIVELDDKLREDDLSKYEEGKLWILANEYLILLCDEKYMENESKWSVFERLVKTALVSKALVALDCEQTQYYIFLKSFYENEPEDINAIIGSIYMKHEEFVAALEGNLSLEEVIARGIECENPERFVRGMILLSAKNEYIKRTIEDILNNIESVDSEEYNKIYKIINKFGDNGTGLADCFEQGIINYIRFRNEFDHITDNSISSIAHKYREYLYDPQNEIWFVGDNVGRGDLSGIFVSIDNYDRYKGFPEKSEQIKKASEATRRILSNIQEKPSLFICDVYKKLLEKYSQDLLNAYQKLCKTSKPILQIGDIKIENDGGKYRVNIPIIPGKNYAQDANNVVLVVKNQRGIKSDNRILVSSRIPSDGNVVWAEVPIELINSGNKLASFELQIEYDYISDIKIDIRTKKLKRNKKRSVSSEPIISKGFFPNDKEFKKIEFLIGATVKKHIINTDRLKKFPKDGAKIDLDDVEIRGILENREKLIKRVINGLTVSESGDQLSQIGRWVILYGQWRVGKSLIMKCVEAYLSDKEKFPHALIISMNCTTGDADDFEKELAGAIYNEILKKIRKSEYQEVFDEISTELGISRMHKPDWSELSSFLELFIEDLRQKQADFVMVILLDEFTNIYEAIIRGKVKERFPAKWTDFINKTNILCITAGGEHTVSLMTTYSPNTIQKSDANVYVAYLMKEDVNKYVKYILGESSADNISQEESYFGVGSKDAIERIYDLTGGNAYILQRYCTWLVEFMNENNTQLLTKFVVDSVLNYLISQPNMDMDSLENDLFNSLYNPFNETEGIHYVTAVKRIDDDQVKDDNLQILHEIVAIASTSNHMCSYSELEETMKTKMDETVFRRRYNTLLQRGIIKDYNNGNIRIFIDLYYEIVSRLGKR